MTKLFIAAILASLVLTTGCRTKSGSREYVPGKGWKEIHLNTHQSKS